MIIDIQNIVDGLVNGEHKYAYQCLKQLEDESNHSCDVYRFFDIFASMLDNTSSYTRSGGIILISANAKWDVDYKIDKIIDRFLKHISDDKPSTSRQCIKSLPLLVKYKPNLKDCVVNELYKANPLIYKESMHSLILNDIQNSLEIINKL